MQPDNNQCSSQAFLKFWPTWRHDMAEKNLVDCAVGCSVECLRDLFFKPSSPFQAKLHQARGDTDSAESEWVYDYKKLPSVPGGYSWPTQSGSSSCEASMPLPGAMRKVRGQCCGTAFYRKPFKVEELQRCVEYIPCKLFVVEVSVVSSPIYCDSFRALNRYSISAESGGSCRLKVDYQIVYVKSLNFLVRGLVERSAHGGMVNSYQKVINLLRGSFPMNERSTSANLPLDTLRLHGLEWELLDDEEILGQIPVTEVAPIRKHQSWSSSSSQSSLLTPFCWLFAQFKSLIRVFDRWPFEQVVRFLSSLLLVFTIMHVAYPHILGMQGSCPEDHWCKNVFFYFTFPQKLQEALSSGILLVLLLRVVDWGLR